MKRTMSIRWNEMTGHYLLLQDFRRFVDVDTIWHYSFKKRKDGAFTLKFFDIKGNPVKPKKKRKK